MRHTFLAVLSLLALAACDSTQSLQDLRLVQPSDDPYLASLAGNYQTMAEGYAAAHDWDNTERFADKGLLAAHGREVGPENPADWNLPAAALPAFNTGREKLIAAIEANKTTQPALTAAAVTDYDRWVASSATNDDVAALTADHDRYFASLAKLEDIHGIQPGMEAISTEPAVIAPPAPGKTATPPAAHAAENATTVLYFPNNVANLGKAGSATISEVAGHIKAGATNVSINGHTDRVGSDRYNMDLSERRAKYVLKALQQAGAPAKVMHYFAFGESDPAVQTPDGVAEPRNRRVEIFIEK